MESLLSHDVQRRILSIADIPIDTFLYFQKDIGLFPKKLTHIHKPPELVASLNRLCQHRVHSFKNKKRLETTSNLSCCLVHITQRLENYHSSEIMIDVDNRDNQEVKMAFRINCTDVLNEEMWTVNKTIVNIHTGEMTTDFFDDSDDDYF